MRYTSTLIAVADLEKSKKFYHEIEVGENMVIVIKRFAKSGLSAEEIAVRMDVPLDHIKSCLQ